MVSSSFSFPSEVAQERFAILSTATLADLTRPLSTPSCRYRLRLATPQCENFPVTPLTFPDHSHSVTKAFVSSCAVQL